MVSIESTTAEAVEPSASFVALPVKLTALRNLWRTGNEGEARRAEDALFAELRPVALHVARRFRHVSLGDADIRQEAFVGLVEAMRNYPDAADTKPVSFLSTVIERRLIHFVNAHSRIVRRPDSWYRSMARVRAAEVALESAGLPSTPTAVAGRLGIDPQLVRRWKSLGRTEVSLAAPAGASPQGDVACTLLDMMEDEGATRPSHALESSERIARVRSALGGLSARDRSVLEMRFCEAEGLSLEAIGDKLGVTRERVRQLEERGLRRMRETLDSRTNDRGSFAHSSLA